MDRDAIEPAIRSLPTEFHSKLDQAARSAKAAEACALASNSVRANVFRSAAKNGRWLARPKPCAHRRSWNVDRSNVCFCPLSRRSIVISIRRKSANSVAFSASSRLFDLNGEARTAKANQRNH
jgi:hypothetical protein